MPFDGSGRDAKLATVAMIDALLEFFGDGEPWTKGTMDDGQGHFCLVGAMQNIRAARGIQCDSTAFYLRRAMEREHVVHCRLIGFNDDCKGYRQLQALLLSAREIASADIEGRPRPMQPRGIPSGFFLLLAKIYRSFP